MAIRTVRVSGKTLKIIFLKTLLKKRAGNGIYVLRIGNDLIVKRTQTLPNKRLLISSANEAYAPFELDLNDPSSDVQIIGKVEWLGRRI